MAYLYGPFAGTPLIQPRSATSGFLCRGFPYKSSSKGRLPGRARIFWEGDFHGLIFQTSVRLLAGPTRFVHHHWA